MVVTVAVLTLGTIGVAVLFLLQQLKGLTATLRAMQDELAPALQQLNADVAVTQRELAQVADRASGAGGHASQGTGSPPR